VTTLIPRPDRAIIRAQVLAITGELLRELGNTVGVEALQGALQGSASLERDLGLGSIERLELFSRLERSLGVSLPEQDIAEAKTIDDIVAAIAGAPQDAGVANEQVPTKSVNAAEHNSQTMEPSPAWPESSARHHESARAAPSDGGFLRRSWETIYGIYAAGLFFVWLPLTWLIVLVMPSGRPAARMTSVSLRIYFKLIGCRIHLIGEEHLDAHGACIYVSNHTSYSDVPVIMALFQTDYHFLAKNEINDMPFVGTFLRKLGHFAFERTKLRARSRQAEEMEKALLRGESLFVFAEGTFVAEPGVRPFQLGAFRAAVKTGRPIVPVALRGARRFHQDGTILPKPSEISVAVCPALFVNPDSRGREWAEVLRLRDETRRIIAQYSGEPLLRPGESRPVRGLGTR
jgi:1-acyl-sn-glycerol-3-phosphate acyltransferase